MPSFSVLLKRQECQNQSKNLLNIPTSLPRGLKSGFANPLVIPAQAGIQKHIGNITGFAIFNG
jgi:hypothetical protein